MEQTKQKETALPETYWLHDTGGFARFHGTDQHGSVWDQAEYDAFAGHENPDLDDGGNPGYLCDGCGKVAQTVWVLMDGGEQYCADDCSVEIILSNCPKHETPRLGTCWICTDLELVYRQFPTSDLGKIETSKLAAKWATKRARETGKTHYVYTLGDCYIVDFEPSNLAVLQLSIDRDGTQKDVIS